ncbi:MAG TPA: glycosyltransferase family 39 protein [Jatrophihabitantaceae bacterium]
MASWQSATQVAQPADYTETQPERGPRDPDSRQRLVLVALGLFGICVTLVGLAIIGSKGVSPIDEAVHADYAYRASHLQIPARGSTISPAILQEISCHRYARGAPNIPPCGVQNPDPSKYPFRGENYNAGHPPLYYVMTGFAARTIDKVLPGAHFVSSGRLVGVVWLFAGCFLLYLCLRRLAIDWRIAFAAGASLAFVPLVFHASSTVNNDAAAPLSGALALWFYLRIAERRVPIAMAFALTLACAATKELNALPFLIIALMLVAGAIYDRVNDRGDVRWKLERAAAILVAFGILHFGWQLYQSSRGLAHWVNPVAGVNTRPVHGMPFGAFLRSATSGFDWTPYYLPTDMDTSAVQAWSHVVAAALAAIPLVVLLFSDRSARGQLGVLCLLGVMAYPFVVELQAVVTTHAYFPAVTDRYGLSLIPLIVAALALLINALNRRWAFVSVVSVGGVAMFSGAVNTLLA